ncbi:MAG: trehalose-phosphatase [Burkholderiales bacterium]|jgi:trehalose 6-phosphate phosphatase
MNNPERTLDHERVPQFADNWALFLDVDGTLLDIAQNPDGVTVSRGLYCMLEVAHRLNGHAVALISGRNLSDLDRLFGPMQFPAAGQHGLERRDSLGRITRATDRLNRISCAAQALEQEARLREGILVEHKGLSLALHYRSAPELREWAEFTMRELLSRLGREFQLIAGKMVYELKPGGRDKGTAIADFMMEAPFAGRVPVFIGDDATDEDGFTVVNLAGGHSIKVGHGDSRARWHLCDAHSVRRWLTAYTEFLQQGK